MDELLHNFIGTGWQFPVEFNSTTGTVAMLSDEADIKSSLDIIFNTLSGERTMHPDFGCELSSFAFAPLNRSVLTYMEALVSDAILFNEPRVVLNNVVIESDASISGLLNIDITYTIMVTNNRYNQVYPFYFSEATNLPYKMMRDTPDVDYIGI